MKSKDSLHWRSYLFNGWSYLSHTWSLGWLSFDVLTKSEQIFTKLVDCVSTGLHHDLLIIGVNTCTYSFDRAAIDQLICCIAQLVFILFPPLFADKLKFMIVSFEFLSRENQTIPVFISNCSILLTRALLLIYLLLLLGLWLGWHILLVIIPHHGAPCHVIIFLLF